MAVKSKSSAIKQQKNRLNESLGLGSVSSENFYRDFNLEENILKGYESITYQISMGALDKQSYNSASYIGDQAQDPRWIVFGESGYTGTKQTGEKKLSEGDVGSRAPAIGGYPEFFINRFMVKTIMPSDPSTPNGNTGMHGGSFEVFEPYSMGQLFESLMSSALLSGYNHFTQAPYLVKIVFHGWNDGKQETIKEATRYIPIRLQNVTFNADGSGSNYTVTYLVSQDVMTLNEFTTDIGSSISFNAGRSPDIALFNLAQIMNKKEEELISTGMKTLADEYIITILPRNGVNDASWPESPAWETFLSDPEKLKNVNLETDVKLVFESAPNTKSISVDPRFVYNASKDKRLKLLEVISDVMCHSTIATKVTDTADEGGNAVYFTIQRMAKYKDPNGPIDPVSGKFPQVFYYTVVPFYTNLSNLKLPSQGIEVTPATKARIKKAYSYTYTGQNDDIINFDLNFNAAFYLSGQPAGFDNLAENKKNLVNGKYTFVKPTPGASNAFNSVFPGAYTYEPDKYSFPNVAGGAGIDATELNVARWVHANVTGLTSSDDKEENLYMLELSIDILGDPFYIPIGGLGNQKYVFPSLGMAWNGEDTRIYVRFRTIQDYPYPGSNLPQVPSGGTDHPFSGVYKLLRNISTFEDGVFKQNLKLVKDLTQDPELDIKGVSASQSTAASNTKKLLGADLQTRSDLDSYDIKKYSNKGSE